MQTLRHAFDCPVGYSDHTEGISVPLAAVGLGAALYEKHVTMAGGKSPDHDFAISMENFARMTEAMRQCEIALGSDTKTLQESEKKYLRRGRRSLFVVKNMSKGDVFTRENLSVLRPGAGLPPIRYEEILGKKASRNINAPALLEEEDWC
jgi:sialic acid synthase SpsE